MSCTLILDTNLLVDYLVREVTTPLVEKLLQFSSEGVCSLLIPELVIDIECRRALSKVIIVKHITNDDKLKVLVSMLKYTRELFEGFNCRVVESWDAEILRRAAAIYYRLSKDEGREIWERRHQDLILWATAEKYGAVLLTRDADFKKLWEKMKNIGVCYVDITQGKLSVESLGQACCACIDDALKEASAEL